ncbi:hypothetical protein PMAYCL1PPCAC_04326 [Pristionchus mayeri]|uniref:Uncharacterized protein n=1 Tax=Pristionchus mayeri TaxID=1317129 RepID=A0AAN5CAN7_9BILA|nr:hypothetical protein PMAYCL1PPCAC_04326 [Pristionchus mayeri]
MSSANGTPRSAEEDAPPVVVRMRNRQPLAEVDNTKAFDAVQRGLEVLAEGETNEETEEIKKLNTQMDHLNDYMNKVEQRLKAHNEKLMETLAAQKREREKRRQSFHERMQTNQEEDTDFSKKMADILSKVNQVNMNRGNRQSMYDFIKE